MAITINIYYKSVNGNAKKFAEEMVSSGVVNNIRTEEGNRITEFREKYDLHMKAERYLSDEAGIQVVPYFGRREFISLRLFFNL